MIAFQPKHDYLVAADSDGCVFDTMGPKHRRCFAPQTIEFFGLHDIRKFALEAWEYVNLDSQTRGVNRFLALELFFQVLAERAEVGALGREVKAPRALGEWIRSGATLSTESLERAVRETGDPELALLLRWSAAVNRAVAEKIHHIPPFPAVRPALEKLAGRADIVVVSATPQEALRREWAEHALDGLVAAIFGHETGSKRKILEIARAYPAGNVLMLGDAPGDREAAEANRTLFFPISPPAESESWDELLREGIDRFFAGTFAGAYQQSLLARFDRCLLSAPPWRNSLNP